MNEVGTGRALSANPMQYLIEMGYSNDDNSWLRAPGTASTRVPPESAYGGRAVTPDAVSTVKDNANNAIIMTLSMKIIPQNNTNSKISISYSDLGVNNKMILSFLSGTHVEPDSKSVVSLARYMLTSFYDGEIPENKDINSIILKFHITPFRSDGSFSTADTIKTSAVKITR